MKATKVFLNGKVYTLNKNRDWAQAVAVSDDKIVFVGSNDDAKAYIGDDTEVFDLAGKMLLPGFTDGHCHPFLGSYYALGLAIDFEWDVETIKAELKKFIDAHPERNAYFGQGYSEFLWHDKKPTKEMLDAICSDKPVILLSGGGHEGWCNTKALEVAGIDKNTPDPVPGFQYFQRDAEGNPTGWVKETAAENMVIKAIKPFDPKLLKKSLKAIFDRYAAAGVTSLGDAACFDYMEDAIFDIVKEMEDAGELKQHISGSTFCLAEVPFEDAIAHLKDLHEKYHTDMFSIHTLKILNDGTPEAHTAALTEPFPGDTEVIPTVFEGEQFAKIGIETAKAGFDIHVHAIGDKAILDTLDMAKAVREAGYKEMRITNAHTQIVLPETRHLFKDYDVIANTTTVWFFGGDMSFMPEKLRPYQFNFREMVDMGVILNLGSDYPADYYGIEPLKGIEMGLTRRVYGQPDAPFLTTMDESLSIDETLDGYTYGALYTHRLENVTGSIEVGKYADLVVLEENLFDVDQYHIHDIPVCMTFMNGKMTYERK